MLLRKEGKTNGKDEQEIKMVKPRKKEIGMRNKE